jgi:putative hemolysin
MSSIYFQILFIVLLIIANGIFSMAELAIVSARKVRLEQWAKRGNVKARRALRLANSPNDFLSTTQIGITLIGIMSGALGGATVAEQLDAIFKSIPILERYSESLSLFIVVAIITYLSLVVGELVPKRLALNNPEGIACMSARPMQTLSTIAKPLVYLLGGSTEILLKIIGIKDSEEPPVTEEEIKVLIDQGTQAGMFEESEQDMVERIFRLGDRPIKALMTPRTEIVWLDLDSPIEENQREILDSVYSRFPVAKGSLDNCIGIVEIKGLLNNYLQGEAIDLAPNIQDPLFIAESTRALHVLELFKQSGKHIALVTDEYGGIEGLVTLNDLLEAIVGDLPSIDSQDEPSAVQREDGSWFLDGMLSIDRVKDLFELEELPLEKEGNYHTLGGLMITSLKKIPSAGEYFEWNNLRFEVADMDGNRVDKVLVTPQNL